MRDLISRTVGTELTLRGRDSQRMSQRHKVHVKSVYYIPFQISLIFRVSPQT